VALDASLTAGFLTAGFGSPLFILIIPLFPLLTRRQTPPGGPKPAILGSDFYCLKFRTFVKEVKDENFTDIPIFFEPPCA
jgi:hypothetical protein